MFQLVKLFFVFVILLNAAFGFGQGKHFVSNLQMEEVNQMFFISWSLDSGQTCEGQIIWHSANGFDYKMVGEIYGICGNLSKPVQYTFTHKNPVPNSINYYRIELGGYTSTAPISAYLIKIENGSAVVYPNPSLTFVDIKWANVNNQNCVLTFYDKFGKFVAQKETKESELQMNVSGWQRGNYTYVILKENSEKITGKLIVI